MLIKARLHQNHCQASATGRYFFLSCTKGKNSASNLFITQRNRSIPLPSSCPRGAKIRCEGHVLDSGMFVQSPFFSFSIFFHYEALLSWHCILLIITTRFCFMSCYTRKIIFFAPYLLEVVCDSKRWLINRFSTPSSIQHDQLWK